MTLKPAPSPQSPAPKRPKGILFVISAPSGAGKTSICRELMASSLKLSHSVSYTTRPMRAGEQDGVDYHFLSRQKFDSMVASKQFVEWAEVHGNCYGTAWATLQRAHDEGTDILLDIDVQGATQLRESGLDAVFLFILPPDLETLQHRLSGRNTDSSDVIARRMQNAAGEISQAVHFDYLVVNDQLEQAVLLVKSIFLAESVRRQRILGTLPKSFNLDG